MKPAYARLFTPNLNIPTLELAQEWYSMTSSYSRLNLTYDPDIFPALSGLANSLSPWGLGTYLAGLWSTHPPLGLSWQTGSITANRSGRQPSMYLAPC
jgi:hypothetical protein